MAIRVPNKLEHEVREAYWRDPGSGSIRTISRKIYVTASGVVHYVWELIKGYLFGKDGYALFSNDGQVIKAKNQ